MNVAVIVMLLWSIAVPERRLWPLRAVTQMTFIAIWLPTFWVFGCAIGLGILDWNGLDWPNWLRWGLGLPLILIGNVVVWSAVANIGLRATSGGPAALQVDGWYRWSRNPQYFADMMIVSGWILLAASVWVVPVAIGIIIALAVAPFAEEPWLRRTYGTAYDVYLSRTARFVGFAR